MVIVMMMMAILKNAISLFAVCRLCRGMPADEGRQEVSRFMLDPYCFACRNAGSDILG